MNGLTQSVAKLVMTDWELMIYWSNQCLDRQNILWPYYVTSGGGERACRGWWWMVLRAGEEDWRGWGGVSTQRWGSVSLILHRNQHQLGEVLFTGLYIYNQTKCKCWEKKKVWIDLRACGTFTTYVIRHFVLFLEPSQNKTTDYMLQEVHAKLRLPWFSNLAYCLTPHFLIVQSL